jgi:type I restriction enzyme S subunit
MRNGWQTKPLADVCEIKPPKSEARERVTADALVSFAPMEDLGIDRKFLNASQVKPLASVVGSYTYFADGDVLLAKITPCFENGKVGIAAGLSNGIGFGSSEFIVFRPSQSLDKEFLYYFLARPEFRTEGAERMGGAVGQQRVPKDFIESYRIPVPPLVEQRRIVGMLDEAFEGIATIKANAEKNLQNAHALFESYLRFAFMGCSDLSWGGGKPLAELCELIVDCEHKTAPTQEEGIPSIRTPNVGKGKLLLEGVYRVSEATYRKWTQRAAPLPGDLILAREAPAGNVAVIPNNLRVCLGQRTVLIRPCRNIFVAEFLAFLLLQPTMQRKLLAHSRGATVQHVNMKDIRALRLDNVPSLKVQREVVSRVKHASDESTRLASTYQRRLTALDALKKSLLHQAFTGKL